MNRPKIEDIDITQDILYSNLNYQLRTPFTITNRSDHTYVFKVKTNQKQAINMPKTHGFILPHTACTLPLKIIDKPHDKFDLKLQVSYRIASEEQIASNVSQMLYFDPRNTFKHIITLRKLLMSANNDSKEHLNISNNSKISHQMNFNFQDYPKQSIKGQTFNSQNHHNIFQQKKLKFQFSVPSLNRQRKNSFKSQTKFVVSPDLTKRSQKSQQNNVVRTLQIRTLHKQQQTYTTPRIKYQNSQNNSSVKVKLKTNVSNIKQMLQIGNKGSEKIESNQRKQSEYKVAKKCDGFTEHSQKQQKQQQKSLQSLNQHFIEKINQDIIKQYPTVEMNSLLNIQKERQLIQNQFQAQLLKQQALEMQEQIKRQLVKQQQKGIQTQIQIPDCVLQKDDYINEQKFPSKYKQNTSQLQKQNEFMADLSLVVKTYTETDQAIQDQYKMSSQEISNKDDLILNQEQLVANDHKYNFQKPNKTKMQIHEKIIKKTQNGLQQIKKINDEEPSQKMIKTSEDRRIVFYEEVGFPQNMTKTQGGCTNKKKAQIQDKSKHETITKSQAQQSGNILTHSKHNNIILNPLSQYEREIQKSQQQNGINIQSQTSQQQERIRIMQKQEGKMNNNSRSNADDILFSFKDESKKSVEQIENIQTTKAIIKEQQPFLSEKLETINKPDKPDKKINNIIKVNKSFQQSVILDMVDQSNDTERNNKYPVAKDVLKPLEESVIIHKYSKSKDKDNLIQKIQKSQEFKDKDIVELYDNFLYHNHNQKKIQQPILEEYLTFNKNNIKHNMTKSSTVPKNDEQKQLNLKISEKNVPLKRNLNKFQVCSMQIRSISSINVNSQSKTNNQSMKKAKLAQAALREQLLIIKTKIQCEQKFIDEIKLVKQEEAKAMGKQYHWIIFIITIIISVLFGSFTKQFISQPKASQVMSGPPKISGKANKQKNMINHQTTL